MPRARTQDRGDITLTQSRHSRPQSPRLLKAAFFRQMGASAQIAQIFDPLPGFHFFVKDSQGRLMAGSAHLLQHLGLGSEDEFLGHTDYDFYPKHMADQMRADDEIVMRTGLPLLNRMEIWYSDCRVLDWYLTNKHPVCDQAGRVIGVMGVIRHYDSKSSPWEGGSRLNKAVEHVQQHLAETITIEQLARAAALSRRQLNRQFQATFAMPPHEFIQRTRLRAVASAMATTDKSLAEIAAECGFCDQSALTQVFRKYVGETPAAYRRRYLAARAEVPGAGPPAKTI